ncbi:hypothetical protein [Microcystis aeruginosa]|uniref:Uncharacterized protein n=1 Tax=Microcystis aeruginosa NIES-3787 TaxID=2517782 RepID=A0A6H9FZ93_MICAE|nr:hypothetical protein [Microcystis aeruginosa]GCL48401.1 hypothetical protein NIES3787_41200 [Microcystis aeruginosa NIES-3787]
MINEGNWQTLYNATNQNDSLTIPLNSPSELILIKVSLSTPQPNWRRAGWLNQYWEKDGNLWLLKAGQVQLNGQLVQLTPINRSLLVFTPVLWLVNWNISLSVLVQSINNVVDRDEKLDEILRRLPNSEDFNPTLLL